MISLAHGLIVWAQAAPAQAPGAVAGSSGITITDGQIIAGIVAVAGLAGFVIRELLRLFMRTFAEQHTAICNNLAEQTKALKEQGTTLTKSVENQNTILLKQQQAMADIDRAHHHQTYLALQIARKLNVANGFADSMSSEEEVFDGVSKER